MVKGRPASVTCAAPSVSMRLRSAAKLSTTCSASAGAPIVATARTSGIAAAATSTAAPPSEWPISSCGAPMVSRIASATRTRSPTLEEKSVEANSPAEWPRPVKSKRTVAMPRLASCLATVRAARMSLVQVKQCANRATASISPSGRSMRAASFAPSAPST